MKTLIAIGLLGLAPLAYGAERSAADAIEKAQEEFVRGHYRETIALVEPFRDSAQAGKVYRLIGASGCFLKDRPIVLDAYDHLDQPGRDFIRFVCEKRNGVSLP